MNMLVITDMIFAIAMITIALRAVAKLQLRIGKIGATADCAAMIVVGLLPGLTEGDRAAVGHRRLPLAFPFHSPGSRHQIQNITSGKQ